MPLTLPGDFRFGPSSAAVYSCPYPDGCVGGNETGGALCGTGFTGALCASAADGFFLDPYAGTSFACDASAPPTPPFVLLASLGAVATAWCAATRAGWLGRAWDECVDWGKIRVVFVTASLMASVPRSLDVDFPEPARSMFEALDFTTFNPLVLFPRSQCVDERFGHYDGALACLTLGVLALCGLSWAVCFLRATLIPAVTGCNVGDHSCAFRQHMVALLCLTYAMYPTLSSMQFEAYECARYDQGPGEPELRLLKADVSIDCDSDHYQTFLGKCNTVFIVLTQMIPVWYLVCLNKAKGLLNPPSERSPQARLRDRLKREQADDELAPVSFLFTHNELAWWRFEALDAYRRVALISLPALIPEKVVASLVGVLLALASAAFFDHGAPFRVTSTNVLAVVGSYQLLLLYMGGLLLKLGYGNNAAGGWLVMVLSVALVPMAIGMSIAERRAQLSQFCERHELYEQLEAAEESERRTFDAAWAPLDDGHVRSRLYATLAELRTRLPDGGALVGTKAVLHVFHPGLAVRGIDNVEELVVMAELNAANMHEKVRALIERQAGKIESPKASSKTGSRRRPPPPAARYTARSMLRRDEEVAGDDYGYGDDFINGKRRVVSVRGSGVFETLTDLDGAITALQRKGSGILIVGLRDNISQPHEAEAGCAYRYVELILAVEGSPVAMEVELEMACMVAVKHRRRFEAEARRVRARLEELGGWECDEVAEEACNTRSIAIAEVEADVESGQLPKACTSASQVAGLPTAIDPELKLEPVVFTKATMSAVPVLGVSRRIQCPVTGTVLRLPSLSALSGRKNSVKPTVVNPTVAFEADEPDSALSGRSFSGRSISGRSISGRFSSGRSTSGRSMSDMTMERMPLPSHGTLTSTADVEGLTRELRASFIEARLAHDKARAEAKANALEFDAGLPPANAVHTAVAARVAVPPSVHAGSLAAVPPPPVNIAEALSPPQAKKLQLGLHLQKAKLQLESANEDLAKAMSQADAALRASSAEQAGPSPGLVEFYGTQLREVAEAVQAKEKRVAELAEAVAAA